MINSPWAIAYKLDFRFSQRLGAATFLYPSITSSCKCASINVITDELAHLTALSGVWFRTVALKVRLKFYLPFIVKSKVYN
jgi:hypothetical protein